MSLLLWLLAALLTIIILTAIIGWLLAAPKYKGPITDHFDGSRFINYGGINANQVDKIFKLLLTRRPTKWKVPKDAVKEAEVIERVTGDQFRITYINHATILFQFKGINLITDPVYARAVGLFGLIGPWRKLPPGISMERLPPIDFVFISHNHYDHLDRRSLKKIIKTHNPQIITTLGNDLLIKKWTSKVQAIDWWNSIKLNEEIELICTPCQHFSSRGLADRDANLWGGFVLKTEEGNIYWSGDSGYGGFFKTIGERLGPMRFSCIPIGAYKPRWFMGPIHISPQEAVQVHQDVRSEQTMAFHWGTFNLADEGWDEPVLDLKSALNAKGLPLTDFQAVLNGSFFHEQWNL